MRLTSLRVGARLARRELRRQPGRAALVILMIAIPTAGATATSILSRTGEWSGEAQRRANMGAAASRASFDGNQPINGLYPGVAAAEATDADVQRLRDALPPNTEIAVEHSAIDRVRLATSAQTLYVTDADLGSSLQRGRYSIIVGRAPRTNNEAAITNEVARKLRLQIGSTFTPERVGHSLRVVGIVALPQGYGGSPLVFAHDVPPRAQTTALIDARLGRTDVPGWSVSGWQWYGQSSTDSVLWSYVGAAVGLFVVGVVVAAAFALGARRQLRTIGLLSSSGASPRIVATTLATQGLVAGALGSLVGIGLGAMGVGLLPHHVLFSMTNQDVHRSVVRLLDLAPIALIGTVAGTIASWFPARTASRLPTLQALASRRPVATPRRRAWFWSAGALALSGALIIYGDVAKDTAPHRLALIAGFVLPLIAALWVAPMAVRSLERRFTNRPLAWRLAGRSLARNGTRSVSVVGATCAVVGLVVGATTLIASWHAEATDAVHHVPYIRDSQAVLMNNWQTEPTEDGNGLQRGPEKLPPVPGIDRSLVRRLHSAAPQAAVLPLFTLASAGGGELSPYFIDVTDSLLYTGYASSPIMSEATPELLDLFDVPPGLRAHLQHDDAIVVAGPGSPTPHRNSGHAGGAAVIHVAGVVRSEKVSLALPRLLLSPALVRRLGWQPQFSGTVALVADDKFTHREIERLNLLESDIEWARDLRELGAPGSLYMQTSLDIGTGPYRITGQFPVRAVGFGAACVLVLAVVAVGLVLNARDSDDERAVLEATGVVPRVRRRVGTRKAALIVLTAVVIAIPLSIIPIAVLVTTSDNHAATFRVDWVALVAMVIALPIVISAATAAGGYARDVLRPRRPILLIED